jgi:hypothetical protein
MNYEELSPLERSSVEASLNAMLHEYAQSPQGKRDERAQAYLGQGMNLGREFVERGWAEKVKGHWVVSDSGFNDWLFQLPEGE